MNTKTPDRQIRALYDDKTIRVYQAYNEAIANAALAHGTFVSPPFKLERMTWIQPSFLWMIYRSGWARKDRDQHRILAIDISRTGFTWVLDNSCPSKAPPSMNEQDWDRLKANSPVRVQWDPECDLALQHLAHRAVQIGLGGDAVAHYVNDWIMPITDVTGLAHAIHDLVTHGKIAEARTLLPAERPYPGG